MNSLENKNYLSALSLSLIIPDIGGKIEFPDHKSVGDRYEKWYNTFIFSYETSRIKGQLFNDCVLDGEVIYKLRCNIFHDGSTEIPLEFMEKHNINESINYKFTLTNKVNSSNFIW